MSTTNTGFWEQFTTLGTIVELFRVGYSLNRPQVHNFDYKEFRQLLPSCKLSDKQLTYHRESDQWIIAPLKSASSSLAGFTKYIPGIVSNRVTPYKDLDFLIQSEGSQSINVLFRETFLRTVSQLNHQVALIEHQSGATVQDWKQFLAHFKYSYDAHNSPQCYFIPIDLDEPFVEEIFDKIYEEVLKLPDFPNELEIYKIARKVCNGISFVELVSRSKHNYKFTLFTPGVNHFEKLIKQELKIDTNFNFSTHGKSNQGKTSLNINIYDSEFGEFVKEVANQDLEMEKFINTKPLKSNNGPKVI